MWAVCEVWRLGARVAGRFLTAFGVTVLVRRDIFRFGMAMMPGMTSWVRNDEGDRLVRYGHPNHPESA